MRTPCVWRCPRFSARSLVFSTIRLFICKDTTPVGYSRDFIKQASTDCIIADDFVRYWTSKMEPKIKDYLGSMEDTIKHLQSMGVTSRANQTQNLTLGLRERGIEQD